MLRFSDDHIKCEFHGTHIITTEELIFYGAGFKVAIPKGMYSDGTSNQGLGFIIKRFGKELRAAATHDYLVNQKGFITLANGKKKYPTWDEAAEVYRQALIPCGRSRIGAKIISSGVKIYGKFI